MKAAIIIILLIAMTASMDGQSIFELGSWSNNANFEILYTSDKLITLTTGGITFLDVEDPTNPIPSASLGNPGGFPMAVQVSNGMAYFGGGMTGYFMIADVSNLNFPVQIGYTENIDGTACQIAVNDTVAFMPTSTGKCYSILISDPTNPVVIDEIDLASFASGVAVLGNYLLVGTPEGLKTIDISDPYDMLLLSSFGGGYGEICTDLINNRIFVSKSGEGFDALDISDPVNPLGLFQGIGGASSGSLAYKDAFVYQIGPGSVSAFAITPTSSTLVDTYSNTINGQVTGVAAKDSIFYVSTVNNVHVLSLSLIPTSISEYYLNPKLLVYPVPSNSQIIIEANTKQSGIAKLTAFTTTGQEVESVNVIINDSKIVHDISNYMSGIYQIVISSNNEFWGTAVVVKE